MKKHIYILLILSALAGCSQKKQSKPYVHPDQVIKDVENQQNKTIQAQKDRIKEFEQMEKTGIKTITDSCECNDYHGMKNIAFKEYGNFKYLLCSYSSEGSKNDTSFLLSGYTLYECNHLKDVIAEGSEINSDLIVFAKQGISIIHKNMFPVKGKKGVHEVPVLKTMILHTEFDISLDTSFILSFKGIVSDNIEHFYSEYFLDSNEVLPKHIDPEIELLYDFINVINKYPKGLEEFKKLKVYGAATREYYFELLRYIEVLEK